jgi:1,4-alpha-glucan branching enzyme
MRPAARTEDRGALALVLHAHMPYVEGFGTWPFGEEWLWEAIATAYVPLLDSLREAPVTLALTPVLCDQLELLPEAAGDRLAAFLVGVRAEVHEDAALRLEADGLPEPAAAVRRAAADYATADRRLAELDRDLLGAFRRLADAGPAELWAGPATHPVLPLLATDAGRRLQLASGLAAHERRFGRWSGGLWLPECAYEPGLERELADFGVRAFCVDQTDASGLGSLDQLEPVATEAGPTAVPVDWETVALVWSARGYPAGPAYRDSHRRAGHDRMPWANDGATHELDRASALARDDAEDFLARVASRLERYRSERGRGGLVCCALDAELLGHWWYEGPVWLRALLDGAERHGVDLVTLPAGLERVEPARRELSPSSWGTPKDLSTWDSPAVAEIAFGARSAELELVSAATGRGRAATEAGGAGAEPALARAARELLAVQSSDWAFMHSRTLAAGYPLERLRGHRESLNAALRALGDSTVPVPSSELRNLAPALDLAPLIAP